MLFVVSSLRIVLSSLGKKGIGRRRANLCKTVTVRTRVRIGEAGANRRTFHSSTLPIRSILRDKDRRPALGAARLVGTMCWRSNVLADCQAESLTYEVHADERDWDDRTCRCFGGGGLGAGG